MPAVVTMPSVQAIQELMSGLLGKRLGVKDGKAFAPGGTNPVVIGVYKRDDGAVAALVVMDIALAANAAAALVLIPPGVAGDSARSGKLAENLLENVKELLNVCGRLFVSPGTAHVRMKATCTVPPAAPPEIAGLLAKPNNRLDLELNIPGYAGGRMAVLI
jgi:hypothetical protein